MTHVLQVYTYSNKATSPNNATLYEIVGIIYIQTTTHYKQAHIWNILMSWYAAKKEFRMRHLNVSLCSDLI